MAFNNLHDSLNFDNMPIKFPPQNIIKSELINFQRYTRLTIVDKNITFFLVHDSSTTYATTQDKVVEKKIKDLNNVIAAFKTNNASIFLIKADGKYIFYYIGNSPCFNWQPFNSYTTIDEWPLAMTEIPLNIDPFHPKTKICKISAGEHHFAFLTVEHQMIMISVGSNITMGYPSENAILNCVNLENDSYLLTMKHSHIIDVNCTPKGTVILDSNNDLYGTGDNEKRSFGLIEATSTFSAIQNKPLLLISTYIYGFVRLKKPDIGKIIYFDVFDDNILLVDSDFQWYVSGTQNICFDNTDTRQKSAIEIRVDDSEYYEMITSPEKGSKKRKKKISAVANNCRKIRKHTPEVLVLRQLEVRGKGDQGNNNFNFVHQDISQKKLEYLNLSIEFCKSDTHVTGSSVAFMDFHYGFRKSHKMRFREIKIFNKRGILLDENYNLHIFGKNFITPYDSKTNTNSFIGQNFFFSSRILHIEVGNQFLAFITENNGLHIVGASANEDICDQQNKMVCQYPDSYGKVTFQKSLEISWLGSDKEKAWLYHQLNDWDKNCVRLMLLWRRNVHEFLKPPIFSIPRNMLFIILNYAFF